MLNILTEPLIRMDTAGGRLAASLPEVYVALMSDGVDAFPALRPHQRHAWHAFLAQLGAMATHRAGRPEPPDDAAEWRRIIRALTPDFPDDEPWQLVVDDITRPAFMQPPARSADRLADYKTRVATPDQLDMLVTSKNHDLKSSVELQADADDWLFALVTLQTMTGYDGSRNYGISRMPSGYGNRPAFSITPSVRHGAHLRRDVAVLLEQRQVILNEYPVVDFGIGLLWVQAWDGTKAETLTIDRMEPFYIEVCRRIRLREVSGKIEAIRANSLDRRISDAKGLTGDPWAPVSNNSNPKGTPPAFLGPRKFGYERIVDGLFSPDWKEPLLLKPTRHNRNPAGTMQLVARGMVRGEGGTAGYHERIIPLKPETIQVFGRPASKQELEDIARERIKQIGTIKRILRHAVATFVAHGKSNDTSAEQRALANPWADKLDEIVDARFFDDLQTEFDADDADERKRIRNRWLRNGKDGVVDQASIILQAAQNALPGPSIQRFKARVQSDGVFWGSLRGAKGLPELLDGNNAEDNRCQNNNHSTPAVNPTETQMPLSQ